MSIKFHWDTRKARQNLQKHQIDFSEASTVFPDKLSITIPDPDHSEDEERWLGDDGSLESPAPARCGTH
jgi:uncharacterized DUF497 family protein